MIHTCELCGVSSCAYLVALDEHAEAIAESPELWLPWNYPAAIEAAAFSASASDTGVLVAQ